MQRQTKLQVAPDAPMSGVKLDSFYQTPAWMAIRAIRAKLTAADLYLWMYLQMLDGSGDVLVDLPSLKDIAETIGISEWQVKQSMAKLEKEGLYYCKVDCWKGQNLSGAAVKKLCEKQQQAENIEPKEMPFLPLEENSGVQLGYCEENYLTTLSTSENVEALSQENTSSVEQQHITAGTLSKIEALESRLAGRGEVPPWRTKQGVNGINLEFAEWLRQKQMHKLRKEIPLFSTLGWITEREPGGRYFTSHCELVAAATEWQQSKLEWDGQTPGQVLAAQVAIALNKSQTDAGVDRFRKTGDKYDWEIAPGEPVPDILQWYAKKIQYSKRPEFTGKPPMAIAREDFCDRILAAGIYEEYQKWAKSVISNHHAKLETNALPLPDATQVTIEVASRPTGTLVTRIKAYSSQAHVAILRRSLQNTINTALQASDVTWEEKIEAFQLLLDNPHLHDWAVEQAQFHGLEIVDGKVEVAF